MALQYCHRKRDTANAPQREPVLSDRHQTWLRRVILSSSQISIQQQQELRKANTQTPVSSPRPDTSCITLISGFSQIHKLVFLMGLAKGPSPYDVSFIQGQDCKVTPRAAITSKHCYKEE